MPSTLLEMKLPHYFAKENCRLLAYHVRAHILNKQKIIQYTLTSFTKKHSSKNCGEEKRKVLLSHHLELTEERPLPLVQIIYTLSSREGIISVAWTVRSSEALIYLKWIWSAVVLALRSWKGGKPPTGIDLPYTRDSGRVDLFYLAKIIITVAESK